MYIINIGDFEANDTVYKNRCLSASIGGLGVESETIPWKGTEYSPWDYKYVEGSFVLDPIIIPVPVPVPSDMDRLEAQMMYTAMMTDTLLGE